MSNSQFEFMCSRS